MVESFVFPAPFPNYDASEYPRELIWIPREAGRPAEEGIPCLLLEARRDAAGSHLLIYFHANAEDLSSVHRVAGLVRDRTGLHVLAVEYPGYGICSGTPCEAEVLSDADAIASFVQDVMNVPLQRVIAGGRSLGGAVAIYMASKHEIGGLVTFATFSSIRSIATAHLGWGAGLLPDMFPSVDRMKEVRCKAVIFHGTADLVVPVSHAEELAGAHTTGQAVCEIAIGLDHDSLCPDEHISAPICKLIDELPDGPRLQVQVREEWQSALIAANVLERMEAYPSHVSVADFFGEITYQVAQAQQDASETLSRAQTEVSTWEKHAQSWLDTVRQRVNSIMEPSSPSDGEEDPELEDDAAPDPARPDPGGPPEGQVRTPPRPFTGNAMADGEATAAPVEIDPIAFLSESEVAPPTSEPRG